VNEVCAGDLQHATICNNFKCVSLHLRHVTDRST